MLRMLKSLAPSRGDAQTVVGISLHRALALAALPPSSRATVQLAELATEPAAQVRALSSIVGSLGLRGCPAAITLPPGSYSLLQIERPPVEDDELVAAARWRVGGMLDYPVEEAVLQVFEAPLPNDRQRTPMLNVVAAPARSVRDLTSVVKKSGLVPQKVTVAELAIRDLVGRVETGSGPVVTVFLTGRQGLIQVTHNGQIHLSRRLDYGLSSVKPVDVLATGIQNTLPLELRRTIDYFDSHFSAGSIRRVLAGPAENVFMNFMRQAGEAVGFNVAPLELVADLQPVPSKTPDYGLPEAYFALGGAMSLRAAAGIEETTERVAV